MADGIRGQALHILVDSVALEGLTDNTLSISNDMDECTSKDSAGNWREFLPGLRAGTGSFTLNYDTSATEGGDDAFDAIAAGTSLVLVFTTGVTAETEWTATGYLDSWEKNDPLEGVSTISGSYTFTGAVVASAVAP